VPMLSDGKGRVVALSAVVTVVTLVAVAAIIGWGQSRSSVAEPGRWVAAATDAPRESDPPSPSASPSASPSPSPSPSPSRKPATANQKATAKPAPTRAAVAAPVAPPPTHAAPAPLVSASPSPGASCPSLTGPKAPTADVQAALVAAAGKPVWPNIGGPAITLRPELVEAIAWEESGWKSTILSCDGGIGTMQIMTDTASWANSKFHTTYDVHTLAGNVGIGSAYLQWLTKYYGDAYFNGSYSLAGDPDKLALLDCVIAAYQAGFGTVDDSLDGPDHTLPNWWYVYAVEGFMVSQPWKSAPATP
jgi:soluble lytic murein transglycosylase-like protein